MVIYHYVEIIGEFLLPSIFSCNIYNHENIYPGEPVYIHIQLLIMIIQENNRLIATKKGRVKLPSFCGNGERVIPFHDIFHVCNYLYLLNFFHICFFLEYLRAKLLLSTSSFLTLPASDSETGWNCLNIYLPPYH